jgi:hypothetical protein
VNVQRASVACCHSCIMTKHFYVHLQELPNLPQHISVHLTGCICCALVILVKGCRHWRNINHILRESSGTKILGWQMWERKGPWTRFLLSNSFPRNI